MEDMQNMLVAGSDPYRDWPRVEVRADILALVLTSGIRKELEAAFGTVMQPLFDRIAEVEQRWERLAARVAELEQQATEARPRRRGC